MITHRMSTKMTPEPPVRFYKTIAITFLILTIALLAVVIFFTSKNATITIVAKSDNKNVNLAIDVSQSGVQNSLKGTVSSTVFSFTQNYYPTSNKVANGLATGEVTIYNDSSLDQPLVQTTRFLTASGVLFRLSEAVNAPANGSVKAKVYADQEGVTGDIGPSSFTIPGLSADRQKQVYAKSATAMSGGVRKVGVLSNDDLIAAKIDYLSKAKASYLSSMPALATGVDVVISIKPSDNIVVNKQVGDQIDQFSLSGDLTVVLVSYTKTELQTIVSNELSKKIDTNLEKVLSVGKDLQVSLSNYDLTAQTARLSVYQDVLVTLDANGSKLGAVNFFNKSKDEIQRYIMGLSHVVGVDVKFSPGWMRSAPSATDRIKVVVKNVK
ncbi:MAG: hypothetical protein COU31_03560 [Candidatus Magasanikbacteria bacterium CG10_big_fil_rev_8_21_14_0_10_40_10]|uniref:Baseplate protein J-like domain-containing protein n=1 Tax=Candidatus Magasanikbacteria bacterium CG10_big_fil_rev_8_21_14_0_10_40_10 TaxID=1974648 RepID=A0A2M6W3H1_9BACT|nr:MAG: hypothetical protein COU31_03560 [Candidatus Magasanikbacteria bacterium CG10_big_fil_rev_8_21_14_0_10_40_10]